MLPWNDLPPSYEEVMDVGRLASFPHAPVLSTVQPNKSQIGWAFNTIPSAPILSSSSNEASAPIPTSSTNEQIAPIPTSSTNEPYKTFMHPHALPREPTDPYYSQFLYSGTPTIKPQEKFNPENDVMLLKNILQKSSVDNDALINILCRRTQEERMKIAELYYISSGKQLINTLKSKIRPGSFNKLMVGLTIPYYAFFAKSLRNCEIFEWLCTICFTLSNFEIEQMSDYFEKKYNRPAYYFLWVRITKIRNDGQLSMRNSLYRMLRSNRNETDQVNQKEVLIDVRQINGIVGGKLLGGTPEEIKIMDKICYNKSFKHIKIVSEKYQRDHGEAIHKVVSKLYPTQSNVNIILNIINFAIDRKRYFALTLMNSLENIDDDILMHTILRRSEFDLSDIKDQFYKMYSKSLRKWVNNETSGHFKKALIALMGEQ